MMMTTETVIYLMCALIAFNAVMQCIIMWILIDLTKLIEFLARRGQELGDYIELEFDKVHKHTRAVYGKLEKL
jgi:uncharacterized membrane protein YccC